MHCELKRCLADIQKIAKKRLKAFSDKRAGVKYEDLSLSDAKQYAGTPTLIHRLDELQRSDPIEPSLAILNALLSFTEDGNNMFMYECAKDDRIINLLIDCIFKSEINECAEAMVDWLERPISNFMDMEIGVMLGVSPSKVRGLKTMAESYTLIGSLSGLDLEMKNKNSQKGVL